MKKFHIRARQQWDNFVHDGKSYCLKHLSAHEVHFAGKKHQYKFIVTYGLHCFAKNEQEHSVATTYSDGHEERQINMERYHLSRHLRGIIEQLDEHKLLYETTKEKYFTFDMVNDLNDIVERCKICLCVFKENRLLRIHVTSAFFERNPNQKPSKGMTIFKVALDVSRTQRNRDIPKEAKRK